MTGKLPVLKGLFLIILTYLIFPLQTHSQQSNGTNTAPLNEGRYRTISISGHGGGHLYSGQTLEDEVVSGYGAITVKYAWQSKDEEVWGPYGFPSYGVGLYSGFLGDPLIFGNPNAIYGFIRFPISNPSRRNEFAIEPSFGLTYNLNPFDPEENPLNDAIGASMAVYFSLDFGFAYKWTREMDIIYGLDFTHFSNGRSYQPNYGLNMLGLNLGLRYHFNADQRKVDKQLFPDELLQARYKRERRTANKKLEKNQSIIIHLALGTTQSDEDAGTDTRYGNFSGILDYQYKFNNMHGATAGFDYFVDNSLASDNPNDPDKYLIGIHGGYDFMFWRFTIGVHMGAYLTDSRGKESYFVRPAFRYDISDRLFAQIGLKTNGFAADWVEWGIGFKPFRW